MYARSPVFQNWIDFLSDKVLFDIIFDITTLVVRHFTLRLNIIGTIRVVLKINLSRGFESHPKENLVIKLLFWYRKWFQSTPNNQYHENT